ncbi:hypothetical protein Tco_1311300 [Tanacetum coccineum]
MPSLASMDNKTLLANVIGLSILVITVIVNIIIQINTGIIYDYVAYIYLAMMLLLLIITVSSSLTIPTSKEILEFKYQATNRTSSTDQQQTQMSLVEKLRQHVRRFWVMAETGSPQFVMASSPLSTASGVKLFTPPIDSTGEINEDLSKYVLQVNDEMELAERTLKGISNSTNSFIIKAEKEQNSGLLELLEKSTGFDGVEKFDTDQIQLRVKHLVKSVAEGLSYTHLVEESLNISRMTATEILNWFADKAEEIVIQINTHSNGIMMENNIPKELIAANSMYRIARTILHRDQSSTEPLSKKQLFALLNGMIADILSVCFNQLTNESITIEMSLNV